MTSAVLPLRSNDGGFSTRYGLRIGGVGSSDYWMTQPPSMWIIWPVM